MRLLNLLGCLMLLGGTVARAQASQDAGAPEALAEAPKEPAPTEAPPPPPIPPSPVDGSATTQAPAAQEPPQATASGSAPDAASPRGQWVYTRQFGWVWIPYDQRYTYVPSDPTLYPSEFVYYPAYGWRWVVAPWVYGYGPAPYWGGYGPRYYVWYARPWFRVGGYYGWGGYRGWGPYRGWLGPRVWGSRGWARAPAYYRTGVGSFHQAVPAYGVHRGAVVRGPSRGPGGGGFHGPFGPHGGGFHGGGGHRPH